MARDPAQQRLIDRVLSNPDQFPDEFWAALPRKLSDNPLFLVSRFQVARVDGESWNDIGATGKPAFANGWVNYGGLYLPAGFRKDYLLSVELRGQIKSGTLNTTAFTLPPGYRPEGRIRIGVDSNAAHGVIEITASGAVIPVSGSNTSFQLDNIRFQAFA